MTDYRDEIIYCTITGALVMPLRTVRGELYRAHFVYPGYLQQWNGRRSHRNQLLVLTATPPKYYTTPCERTMEAQPPKTPHNGRGHRSD